MLIEQYVDSIMYGAMIKYVNDLFITLYQEIHFLPLRILYFL